MGLSCSKKVQGNGNQTVHVGYAKSTCKILVFYNKYAWYWNKNIFIFVIYMLYNRCIFFFFYVFPIERSMLTLKQNGLLIYLINDFANHFVSELS